MTKIIGRPAEHARKLATQARLRLVAATSGALALTYGSMVCYSFGLQTTQDLVLQLGSLGGLVGALVLGRVASVSRLRLRQARVGIAAETRSARILKRSGAAVVVNGADLGIGGDCDHLVLGPWAVAVETKAGRGRLSFKSGELRVGGKGFVRDPIEQALTQARAASSLCGTTVRPVVCVVGATNVIDVRGVTVCGASRLDSVLRSSPAPLDSATGLRLSERLATSSQ